MNSIFIEEKKAFIEAAVRAYTRGIQTGSGGNISLRIPKKKLMVVKPSGVSFIECTLDNLVVTDFDGKVIEGNLKPTREFVLHGELYKKYNNIGGIVHCHSPWSIAWSYTRKDLPVLTKHSKMKMKCAIPTIDINSPVVPKEELSKIFTLFEKQPDLSAFILVGHGIFAIGSDVLKAEHIAELVEETAHIKWLYAIGRSMNIIKEK